MRDMSNYVEEFDNLEFEDIQSFYRKKKFFEVTDTLEGIGSTIEIGCGESSIFEFRRWQKNVLIEPVDTFINRLDKRIDTKDIEISNCFLEDFSKSDTFDLIVVSCLLHEISNKINFMDCIRKLMHPKSLLYLDVPNALSIHRYLAVSSGYLDTIYSVTETSRIMQQSNSVFSVVSLEELINSCGFAVIDMGTNFIKFFHHARMAELVAAGHLRDKELDSFYHMQKDFPENGSEIWCLARKNDV
jgi:trans-aconitate methyltransferase